MDNNPKNLSDAAAMAQFRLALIAPVIHGLYPDASRNAYYQRVTERPLTLPDGSVFQYSPKTLNGLLKDYMRTYNTSVHSGIGTTPLERYQKARSSIRMPKSREWLEECFLNRIARKANKDSTVSIDKVSYDVPMQFISSKVEIRFLPDDMSSAFILYEGEHYPIRPTDKNENCRTKRNNTPSIDYSRIGGEG
ncbi:Mu transposase C-terminal domain-containing protein [uncultured Acetatifactor sp.]|uniref:Mu transposase C-terminal domain-containing protein n=1 Tax=uncultured Acetatifactor sp. TaxID=1671927 RepID=UPI00261FBB14|nr:Mu transposase C-terminal domain-containing protein [uncultured Acetatifactor sp.]